MKGLWAILGISFVLFSSAVIGYTYDIKVLRKWHPEDICYHYWIGFCDFHDKTHKDNSVQRAKIEQYLPMYNQTDLLVLVEDLSSPNDEGRLGCGSYYINSRVGVLAGLGNFCKLQNIPVQNVEYRYCRVVALGPVINNITADPSLFPSTKKLTVTHLIEEIGQVQKDLVVANQEPVFKDTLTQKSAQIANQMKKLHLLRDQKKTIVDYLMSASTPMNRLELIKTLLTFDGIFIGMRFATATMKAGHAKKIFAFGGGTHINEAYELLQKVDAWEPVAHFDTNASSGSVLGKSIGGTNTAGYFTKPRSVSLELIEHYLKN